MFNRSVQSLYRQLGFFGIVVQEFVNLLHSLGERSTRIVDLTLSLRFPFIGSSLRLIFPFIGSDSLSFYRLHQLSIPPFHRNAVSIRRDTEHR